jgi:hypothetical protein
MAQDLPEAQPKERDELLDVIEEKEEDKGES